jgi:hypothetical protein
MKFCGDYIYGHITYDLYIPLTVMYFVRIVFLAYPEHSMNNSRNVFYDRYSSDIVGTGQERQPSTTQVSNDKPLLMVLLGDVHKVFVLLQ